MEGRNLVICCDGTNNSPAGNITSVYRISRLADIARPLEQLVLYDPGVGVEPDPRMKTGVGEMFSRWFGSAFGTGLVANVEQAYVHLVEQYAPGDRIFLFGFSRGAYTVRVIAGLLYAYHLLPKDQVRRAPEVVRAFRDLFDKPESKKQARLDDAARYREAGIDAPVHFMGLFDTVSSMGWAYDPKTFPNTSKMPKVRCLRHAMAIDERRAKFRANRIVASPGTDQKELWFAGVHCDVGGGYAKPNDRLSRVPLRWMLREARAAGLLLNPEREAELNLEGNWQQDEQEPQNESLDGFWKGLELLPLPHRKKVGDEWVESRRVYRSQGWRGIDATDAAHESLQRRRVPVKNVHWKDRLGNITFQP